MNSNDYLLKKLYRQQVHSEKHLDQIKADALNSQVHEESMQLFEQLLETKSNLVTNYSLSSTYSSYRQETLKAAINVVQ
ncbi:hypothetical protein [Pseudomonas sp. AN3A02]|uniref:hypothetical protein n=1 Tax=Pseudomonas sp. AN3A02 TaxID=2719587 RepID=UPI0014302313|nr:hypothetical protein [Pseudomonas sp. AN3A02]NIL20246.1 hypothetical protein [Pseudomonas sp. AN3A02]